MTSSCVVRCVCVRSLQDVTGGCSVTQIAATKELSWSFDFGHRLWRKTLRQEGLAENDWEMLHFNAAPDLV